MPTRPRKKKARSAPGASARVVSAPDRNSTVTRKSDAIVQRSAARTSGGMSRSASLMAAG
jgi:hypothetical protein